MRDPACVFAFARTVARRLRYRAIHRATAMRRRVAEVGLAAAEDLAVRDGDDRPALRVGGEWVEVDWLVERIGEVLGDLGPLNEPIVRGYYAGSSCRELGARYGLPPAGVKARIYRGRARIRSGFTERVRNAHRTGPSGRSRRSNCTDSEGDE
jgi:DNA-directed RNA polymerase specialized sigma24 family protein